MGLYDLLIADARCPWCGHTQSWRIQYKYGFCRLHENRLRDLIMWTDPPNWASLQRDDGKNVGGLVKVAGGAEHPCAQCGKDDIHATITVKNNRIHAVELAREEVDLGPDGYVQVDAMHSSELGVDEHGS